MQTTNFDVTAVRVVWTQDEDGEGCHATAEIRNPRTHVVQHIRSGGLYGIDAPGAAYRMQVEAEQLGDLSVELNGLGIAADARTLADIAAAS